MEEFVIEKNIPIKNFAGIIHQGRPFRYPFEKMELEDSFLIPLEKEESYLTIINSVTSCRCNAAKKLNMKFVTRKVCESGQWGIRVWRKS